MNVSNKIVVNVNDGAANNDDVNLCELLDKRPSPPPAKVLVQELKEAASYAKGKLVDTLGAL